MHPVYKTTLRGIGARALLGPTPSPSESYKDRFPVGNGAIESTFSNRHLRGSGAWGKLAERNAQSDAHGGRNSLEMR